MTAVGIVLGLLMPRIQAGATVPTSRAGQLVAAVGFGILGLVTVIYSLLFGVVQSSNSTFSPRLNLFQDNPWIWRTYAAALGLFAFSMSAFLGWRLRPLSRPSRPSQAAQHIECSSGHGPRFLAISGKWRSEREMRCAWRS